MQQKKGLLFTAISVATCHILGLQLKINIKTK